MNKFFSLAIASLATAAFLSSCSDDKSESRADICKEVNEKCLIGEWGLTSVENYADNSDCRVGTLKIFKDKSYSYRGTCGLVPSDQTLSGTWTLDGNTITLNCMEQDDTRTGTIEVSNGTTLKITAKERLGVVTALDAVQNPIEVFTFRN